MHKTRFKEDDDAKAVRRWLESAGIHEKRLICVTRHRRERSHDATSEQCKCLDELMPEQADSLLNGWDDIDASVDGCNVLVVVPPCARDLMRTGPAGGEFADAIHNKLGRYLYNVRRRADQERLRQLIRRRGWKLSEVMIRISYTIDGGDLCYPWYSMRDVVRAIREQTREVVCDICGERTRIHINDEKYSITDYFPSTCKQTRRSLWYRDFLDEGWDGPYMQCHSECQPTYFCGSQCFAKWRAMRQKPEKCIATKEKQKQIQREVDELELVLSMAAVHTAANKHKEDRVCHLQK